MLTILFIAACVTQNVFCLLAGETGSKGPMIMTDLGTIVLGVILINMH